MRDFPLPCCSAGQANCFPSHCPLFFGVCWLCPCRAWTQVIPGDVLLFLPSFSGPELSWRELAVERWGFAEERRRLLRFESRRGLCFLGLDLALVGFRTELRHVQRLKRIWRTCTGFSSHRATETKLMVRGGVSSP